MDRTRLNQVIALVNVRLADAGYDCIEAEWAGDERILRLFVDRIQADDGVPLRLDDCVKASKLLDDYQELDALVPGSYSLEVSSPGVERPLRRSRDFRRHLGETVEVKLVDKIQDRKHGTGKLLEVAEKPENVMITLETNRGPWSFPLASLQRASLVYDWSAR
ncbi:ribosome maturation factor RimP [Planctomyces bekefii]|uniref:Ribosome maturation factor RimP n=1 Tax=Planctomyces bekefii TaxID=1653850 RepID=A0A5C6M6T6_9PLAN|nr:ribosome maturation factor RimP [Planctomyces bekefii]